MIQWTIQAALGSGVLDRLIVSTDDVETADLARTLGAEVPFLRPRELATATAPAQGYLTHLIQWLDSQRIAASELMILQPTSPLRTAQDIVGVWRLRQESAASSVTTVTAMKEDPRWILRLDENGHLRSIFDEELRHVERTSSQLRTHTCYRENGAVYLIDRQRFENTGSLYYADTRAYVMPPERSLDLDTEHDWLVGEALHVIGQDQMGSRPSY